MAQYGWEERFPSSLLDQGRFDSDGQILSGPHFGTYMVEDVVGIFYNKEKLTALGLEVPATWEQFIESLTVAKAAGEIPVMVGNIDKWPIGHVYGLIYNRYATTEDINGWTFNTKPEVKWTDPGFVESSRILQNWGMEGYFTPDFNAVGYDDAVSRFGAGEGLYLPAGTWALGNLRDAGDHIGFFVPPPLASDPDLRVQGGQGQFWAISGKSEIPEVAAAYLDFLTSDRAGELLVEHGNLPGFAMASQPELEAGLYKEVYDALQVVNAEFAVSTYVDASTATMLTTFGEGHQKLLAGIMTPEEFNASVQADHDAVYMKP
jgi:raffinose/stachyose/melibiose transport system substrate-binding protein